MNAKHDEIDILRSVGFSRDMDNMDRMHAAG